MSFLPIMLRSLGGQLRQHNEVVRHFLRPDIKEVLASEEIKLLAKPFLINNFKKDNKINEEIESQKPDVIIDKDEFQLNINVQQFEPEDIIVKTLNNMVIIEGKHDERLDETGLISRHFVRKYPIPESYNIKELNSTLSLDGILIVKAPTLGKNEENKERIIKIELTGELHEKIKEKSKN